MKAWEEESITLDLEKGIREKELFLDAKRNPFKKFAEAARLMEDVQVPRDRRKVLVLGGANRVGARPTRRHFSARMAPLR